MNTPLDVTLFAIVFLVAVAIVALLLGMWQQERKLDWYSARLSETRLAMFELVEWCYRSDTTREEDREALRRAFPDVFDVPRLTRTHEAATDGDAEAHRP